MESSEPKVAKVAHQFWDSVTLKRWEIYGTWLFLFFLFAMLGCLLLLLTNESSNGKGLLLAIGVAFTHLQTMVGCYLMVLHFRRGAPWRGLAIAASTTALFIFDWWAALTIWASWH